MLRKSGAAGDGPAATLDGNALLALSTVIIPRSLPGCQDSRFSAALDAALADEERHEELAAQHWQLALEHEHAAEEAREKRLALEKMVFGEVDDGG